MDAAIRTEGLSKNYRSHRALRELNLEVPRGVVFGYLGPNGAGKTTTIRILAGLISPTTGSATVLGNDVVDRCEDVQRHLGYLPGEFVGYPDLTGAQYLRYLANLRGGVDWSEVDRLAKRFELDLGKRFKTLSHGNKQKLGIVQAFMHRPELLILDEPTSGLDPIMQREFLALLRETRADGRTVFLSSHILSDVEAVADTVAILRSGELVITQSVEALRQQALRRLELTFSDPPPVDQLKRAAGVQEINWDGGGTVQVEVAGSTAELLRIAAPHQIINVVSHEADLEAIFLDYYTARS
ncbi:ABC-2 type transport system ATP-binding protein [Kribbella orskensis]|uniref:ABC-2 type transport system ATP-binding protein n=2 Tax=Kribbellaceae TaxID=2726069 RepID=A0ABY2B6G0_9ACTN|nr:ABC-2 type transport system ATP-binding protein [Kribbella sp. VKM Ac-2500]TCO07611.1 ABC-2 type transport system ATP-binding protein [Kribbella orskensis]